VRTIPYVTLVPADSYIAAVKDHDDLFSFAIPMEAKALGEDGNVRVEENGDLILSGYAAVWEGEDREGENFVPGAFTRAAKAFLDAGGPLCFHHKRDHVLGQVTDLREDGKGLKMEARVDGEIAKHPVLGTIYNQIKKGTLKGLSVGGFFKRALIEGKRRIADMDFTEISVTGVPVHTGPSFAVVAGKALLDDVEVPTLPEVDEIRDSDKGAIVYVIGELNGLLERVETAVKNRSEPDQHTDPNSGD
jgi:HK97 family phage prohead protease